MRTPGRSVAITRTLDLTVEQPQQILSVGARAHRAPDSLESGRVDISHPVGNLFETRHHQSPALLDRLDVIRRLYQRFVRAGIEPRDATSQLFDVQLLSFEVRAIDIGDFELAASGWLQLPGDVDHLVVVEIQPGDGERGP